ncbi:betaine/proline/choline family ABC transporter ATP-binding protein [Bacillus tianshenii]|nr:betaine/proline/choline family ABC transporter ATP-binding protein [Bacillus tianshenii]
MIRFENVSKKYQDGTLAIQNMNLTIPKGELLTLIGPSGCGKTTTMKMINRLIEPTEGRIFVDEQDISQTNPVELRRNIGYVIQRIGLLPHMTIEDNIALVPKLKKWPKQKYEKRVDELLDLVGLDPHIYKGRYPAELSGGQQQRIGVVRALAAEPPVILMDEPFSALDPISREQLQDELLHLQNTIHKTIVFVTHDMNEALKIADRMALMKDGEIIQLDTPQNIVRHPKDDFVAEFIGDKGNPLQQADLSNMVVKWPAVKENERLSSLQSQFEANDAEALVVVDEQNHPVGIITAEQCQQYQDQIAEKQMKNVKVMHVKSSYQEAATALSTHTNPYLAVVNDDGYYAVLTMKSFVDGIANLHRHKGGA